METLGYIGLGLMGLPMTRRLIAAGDTVAAWNRSPEKLAAAVAAGARAALSPADVASRASIIFMCLTDAAAVEAVAFGEGGLAQVPGEGRIVVDFSSIHPERTREIARRIEATNGLRWIDAPVSGGTRGAEEGTLAVMAGGDAADVARVAPHVLKMARGFTHMGPLGAGQTTKLCNQVIVGCTMAVLAEATRLAVNAGIDARRLPEALKGGFANSIPLQMFVPRMVEGIHVPPLGPCGHHAEGPRHRARRGARDRKPGADGEPRRAAVSPAAGDPRRGCRGAGNLQAERAGRARGLSVPHGPARPLPRS